MPLTLANPKAFAGMMDTEALVKRPGDLPGDECRVMASVSGANPYAENVGGAARAEYWSVAFIPRGTCRLPRGAEFSFPGRPDLPSMYVQKSYLLGGVAYAQCTSAERPTA